MNLDKFKPFIKTQPKKAILNFEVWLYTRVSSRDQELNRSLDSQRDEGHKYAKAHNYNITTTFGATYESASGDFTRKDLSVHKKAPNWGISSRKNVSRSEHF